MKKYIFIFLGLITLCFSLSLTGCTKENDDEVELGEIIIDESETIINNKPFAMDEYFSWPGYNNKTSFKWGEAYSIISKKSVKSKDNHTFSVKENSTGLGTIYRIGIDESSEYINITCDEDDNILKAELNITIGEYDTEADYISDSLLLFYFFNSEITKGGFDNYALQIINYVNDSKTENLQISTDKLWAYFSKNNNMLNAIFSIK